MLNPFEDNIPENSRDTDRFIPSTVYIPRIRRTPLYCYIIIAFIYVFEIFTTVLGGTNDDKTIGLNNSGFTIQYWLMIFGIFNICGLILIYQFNQRTYKNKIYFIFYEFIKSIWLIIGFIILFKYNLNERNFICEYGLFYTLFETLWMCYNLVYTIRLNKYDYNMH